MRPSRTILATAVIAAPVAAALGLLSTGSPAPAAATTSLAAPVASAPAVVATTVPASKRLAPRPKAAAHARPQATTHHSATPHRTVAARRTAPQPVVTHTTAVATATSTSTRTASSTTSTPAVRTGNDYPYASATTNAPDQWGFTERQCVSFAAWRLARDGHPIDNAQGWGSAYNWDDVARARGVRVSTTPHVGAIAQWNAGEGGTVWVNGGQGHFTAGSYGHVGYVAAVYSDGSVLVEQYNAMGDRSYSAMRMTAPRFLF